MAIRADLSADRERGPGHGRLRVGGFDPGDDALELSLMRNQGTAPYLGNGGIWQPTEAWHPAVDVERAAGELVIRVGPEIVDPIVTQPTTVAYRLLLAAGVKRDAGTLRVSRPLLGSGAASEERPAPAAEAVVAGAVEEPAKEPERVVVEPPPPVVVQPRRFGPIVALLVLLMLGAVAGAWWACLLPGIGPARCAGRVASIEEEAADEGETPPSTMPSESAAESAAASASASCAGLDAGACLAKAEQALGDGKLEPARQLFQEAAGLGSVEANNRMARMYDPETWSSESSPVAQPDWETAAYWYEAAAKHNDVAGKAGAGRLLCRHADTSFERKRAVEYLKAAAESGDESAKKLVAECEGKVS